MALSNDDGPLLVTEYLKEYVYLAVQSVPVQYRNLSREISVLSGKEILPFLYSQDFSYELRPDYEKDMLTFELQPGGI